jgi:uroporphyrinogen-III decarboxylase
VNKKKTKVPILVHMCGDTIETMQLLPDAGVECFSCDVKVNLAAARKSIGKKMAIMGNINPVKVLWQGHSQERQGRRLQVHRRCRPGRGVHPGARMRESPGLYRREHDRHGHGRDRLLDEVEDQHARDDHRIAHS